MEKKEKKLVYVEPEDYFPKEILEKYFPEVIENKRASQEKQEDGQSANEKSCMIIREKT